MPAHAVRRDEVRDLTREHTKSTMEKCYDAEYVMNWRESICNDIFQATYELMLYTVEKLRRVREGADAEEDCICLLGSLLHAWDVNSYYHAKYAEANFPAKVLEEQKPQIRDGVIELARFWLDALVVLTRCAACAGARARRLTPRPSLPAA